MGGFISQLFPPTPTFTEKNLPLLTGKVFIVTGGNAGVGLELVKILYSAGGTVYIAGRSPTKTASVIESIQALPTATPGTLKSLPLDLSDLTTVAPCASAFLSQESRLDILFNNAGIAQVPPGSLSVQGHEAHMGTNCLGPYLFTKLLLPILIRTAKTSPEGSVRLVFTSSSIVDIAAPPGGISFPELVPGSYSTDKARNYAASKAGNWLLASEFHRRIAEHGMVSVTQNPGNLKTKSWDGIPVLKLAMRWALYEPRMGAYTELWCGLSPEVKVEDGGRFASPWGRWHPNPRKDILESLKTKEEGGTGIAGEFWKWCDEETKKYVEVEK